MYLGFLVKDEITGFIGVSSEMACYITGCDQYYIQPIAKENTIEQGYWFDLNRIKLISDLDVNNEFEKITFDESKRKLLGSNAKDKITGFKGIITGMSLNVAGEYCVGITPKTKKNKVSDTKWFSLNRVKINLKKDQVNIDTKTNVGGPTNHETKPV